MEMNVVIGLEAGIITHLELYDDINVARERDDEIREELGIDEEDDYRETFIYAIEVNKREAF